jgi:hypothetical protein
VVSRGKSGKGSGLVSSGHFCGLWGTGAIFVRLVLALRHLGPGSIAPGM